MKDLYANPEVRKALNAVFDSKDWWRYKGHRTRELEDAFAQFHNSTYGVSVCNGTVNLDIVFKAIGLKPGDEVILPAYDFFSLPKSVLNFGAIPVFVDVNNFNYTINSGKVSEKINEKTKAIISVNIDGSLTEVDKLANIAREHNIFLIEDCAQAHGALYNDKRVGSFGDFGLFSFGGIKLMTSGQGGMIITKNEEYYQRCYAIANRGLLPNGQMNPFGLVGENYQLSELQAAILLPQLEQLDELGQKREEAMKYLDSELSGITGINTFTQFIKTQRRAQMRYSFWVDPEIRTSLQEHLHRSGLAIDTGYSNFQNDERLPNFKDRSEEYPSASKAQGSILSILHPFLLGDERELQKLVDEVRSYFI